MWAVLYYKNGFYHTICDCGNYGRVSKFDFEHKKSRMCKSCSRKITSTRHGYKDTRIYRIWKGMRTRCYNPNSKDYCYYGKRGIAICERWNKFENFLEDMGEPPTNKHSIDRINNDGNYEPNNCRWTTQREQIKNSRPRLHHSTGIKGITYTKNHNYRVRSQGRYIGSFQTLDLAKNALNEWDEDDTD